MLNFLKVVFYVGLFFMVSCLSTSVKLSNSETIQVRQEIDDSDKIILTKYLDHCKSEIAKFDKSKIKSKTKKNPEMLCWVELKQLRTALVSYELTGDVEYLRLFKSGFDKVYSSLSTNDDGYLGWIGLPIADSVDPAHPDLLIDEIQTSFQAISVIGYFCSLVKRDVSLVSEFQNDTERYLDLAENHLFKKWDSRGSWEDLGKRGGVYRWNMAYKPERRGVSLPFEKLSMIAFGLIDLYHATTNDIYLRRAVKIGTWFKYTLKIDEEHYLWHYWEPAGSWDMASDGSDKWRHWIGTEPNADWHNATLSMVMALYRHGLVFDDTDLKMFLNTQEQVCWNGDAVAPVYKFNGGQKTEAKMVCFDIASYSEKFSEFLFRGDFQKNEVQASANPWWGLVAATDWVRAKYLSAERIMIDIKYGKVFLKKKDNVEFCSDLQIAVAGKGYETPIVPSSAEFIKQGTK